MLRVVKSVGIYCRIQSGVHGLCLKGGNQLRFFLTTWPDNQGFNQKPPKMDGDFSVDLIGNFFAF